MPTTDEQNYPIGEDDKAAATSGPKQTRSPSQWLVGVMENGSFINFEIIGCSTAKRAVELYLEIESPPLAGPVVVYALRPDAEALRFQVVSETVTNTVITEGS